MTEVYKIINAVRKIAFPTKQKHGDTKLNNKTFTTNKTTLFIQCIMGELDIHMSNGNGKILLDKIRNRKGLKTV